MTYDKLHQHNALTRSIRQQRLDDHLLKMSRHVARDPETYGDRIKAEVKRLKRHRTIHRAVRPFVPVVVAWFVVSAVATCYLAMRHQSAMEWWKGFFNLTLASVLWHWYQGGLFRDVAVTDIEISKSAEQSQGAFAIDARERQQISTYVAQYPVFAPIVGKWLDEANGRLTAAEMELLTMGAHLHESLSAVDREAVYNAAVATAVWAAAKQA